MTGFPKTVRELIHERSQGFCEVCGQGRVEQLHHRRGRGMGSSNRPETNAASNGLGVDARCHALIESRREMAFDRGWAVRQNFTPSEVPVLHHGAGWVLLQADGGVFVPPRGKGRCERCGFYVVKQGHRDGCQIA